VLAFLQAGAALDSFVTLDHSPHGWISGLDLSARPLPDGSDFLALLRFLKQKGLNIQIDTCGRNPHILTSVITEGLCDKMVFILHGPASRYEDLTGLPLDEADLSARQRICRVSPLLLTVPTYSSILKSGSDWFPCHVNKPTRRLP
jgi:pyruvate formate lyase activating enzyme